MLERSQVDEQCGVVRVTPECFLGGLKSQLALIIHTRADVREHLGDTTSETSAAWMLEVVDGRVDEQTDGCGEWNGVGFGGKKKGRVVLLCVVPVPGDEVQRFCSDGKELVGLQIECLTLRPVIPHSLEESCHSHKGFVLLLEPPSHLEAQVVVVVGSHKVIQTVIRLR